jgi:methyl acetate hydrolase
MGRYMETKKIPGIISCQNAALTLPLVFDPGDRWDYGIGTDWAGKAVERVSGQRLGDYFDEHLFGPIGMRDTGFKLTDGRGSRLAGMHARGEDGTLARMDFELPQEPEFQMGGGGLYGTASDYLAFQRVILNGGRVNGHTVLKPETVRQMTTNSIGDLNVQPLNTVVPHLSHDAEFFPRHAQEMEHRVHDLDAASAGQKEFRQSRLGGPRQHVFLDRSGERHSRRDPDATSTFRRPESPECAR